MLFSSAWEAGLRTSARAAGVLPRTTSPFWYVVRCVGAHDARVIECLVALGLTVYYPLVRELRRVPRRNLSHTQRQAGSTIMRPTVVPLLPRHVFVRDAMASHRWREMFDVSGVSGLLSFGGAPAPIADATIRELRSREFDGVIPNAAGKLFAAGDRVRMIDGPFTYLTGFVEKLPDVAPEKIDLDTRLRIMVQMLGRATSVDVPIGQVEKV